VKKLVQGLRTNDKTIGNKPAVFSILRRKRIGDGCGIDAGGIFSSGAGVDGVAPCNVHFHLAQEIRSRIPGEGSSSVAVKDRGEIFPETVTICPMHMSWRG